VVTCLADHFSHYHFSQILPEFALELVFCYRLGLGVPADNQKAMAWLVKSNRPPEDLQRRLGDIQARINVPHTPIIEWLCASGHLAENALNDYSVTDAKDPSLQLIEQEHQREITEMQHFFQVEPATQYCI
jgi:hypothetical protein